MRLDEFTLAGEQPSPVQRAVPASAQPTVQTQQSTGDTFGDHVKNLVAKEAEMDPSDPRKGLINKFLAQVEEFVLIATEDNIQEAVARAKVVSRPTGVQSNVSFIKNAQVSYLNGALELWQKKFPNRQFTIDELMMLAENLDEQTEISAMPDVKKSTTAAIKGIQLNSRGEIGKLDADIEAAARELVDRFGVKLVWARNLVGMFSMDISREDRVKFLHACVDGTALDVPKMLAKGEGKIEDYVTNKIPTIKKVFDNVKATLLDISLSTGQRGATGPFEALLAIMGGAVKPAANEGGDVKFAKVPGEPKYEVKSTSLSPNSDLNKAGELPATGGASEAWLDSMAMKDISGSALRSIANDWLASSGLRPSAEFKAKWGTMDFRSKKLGDMAEVSNSLEKRSKGTTAKFIKYLMGTVFPTATKVKGYNFDQACDRIVAAIQAKQPRAIAKEQGIMALIQYALGKGNDGFILFNSSTQDFKVVNGVKGILDLVNSSGNVHFYSPMTLGKNDRASPGIYFGPDPTSDTAKEYFRMFNSDPKRVARARAAALAKKQGKEQPDLTGFN